MMQTAKASRSLLSIKAASIARVHTCLALSAFLSALILGCVCHYKKIVKNGVAGYPQEWFPSVSATIGDWYPERSIFHILIALTSGPRFAVVFMQYMLRRSTTSSLPMMVLVSGIVRTMSCGGWVYITSNDDHDAHDILMITYIVCNIPWMLGGIACTPKECQRQRRLRNILASFFFISIIPMVYFFIRHKVHRIPGAYTHYAFFEWGLIFADVLYDSIAEIDFTEADFQISLWSGGNAGSIPMKLQSHEKTSQKTSALVNVPSEIASSGNQSKEVTTPGEKGGLDESAKNSITSNLIKMLHIHAELRAIASFITDSYLAYIFWSIYTSLPPSFFYFSVWELGIGGAELSLLTILSSVFLGFTPFKKWASSKHGRITIYTLSFLGIVARELPMQIQRLFLIAFASFCACIGAVTDWSGLSGSPVWYQSILCGLGLIISSLSKHANYSNNPVWPMLDERSGSQNRVGLILGALAMLEIATRHPYPRQPSENATAKRNDIAFLSNKKHWLFQSIPLGGLIFCLHSYLTDASTMIAWTWTGYPVKGPVSNVHGSLTLLAQATGLAIPIIFPSSLSMLSNPIWFFFGSINAYLLYAYDDWLGYLGGLGMAVFLMSIIPLVFSRVSETENVGRVYFTAFLVTIIIYLASTWTVAYAFVPGGDYLRERTDLIMLIQMLLLSPAFTWSKSMRCKTYLDYDLPFKSRAYVLTTLSLIMAVSSIVSLYHTPTDTPQPFRPGPRILRAGIWTVHFGMDNEGRDSQWGMRDLIKDMELDIVGLLETDLHRPVFGNRDLTRVLVEDVGYFVDIGPGPDKHTWGAVLLSKFPIINSTHHLLPSPHGELAPAISAFLDVWGTEIMVVVAHNGQEEDPLDRELQSAELARIMSAAYPTPIIFLGYVVTRPHSPRPAPYKIIVEDGRVHDIDALDFDRWCEYIFYRGVYRTSYLRMSRGKITDTELQIGQFVVPRFGHNVTDDSEAARYLRRNKEALATDHWFPMDYYGNEKEGGKNGHFYHVFGTPLYYDIPENAVL